MDLKEEKLAEFKRNIINWYPFKDKSDILEVWEGNAVQEENKLYDYVVIIGIGNKNLRELIEKYKNCIKDDGILIIAVNNKLGLDSFCIKSKENNNKVSKKELLLNLDEFGFKARKFYYPMPNYKTTNVIYTDKWLPSIETINRSLPIYNDEVLIALEEKERFQILMNENPELFKDFANSFLVECSKNELEDNTISFVSYSNIRKSEYRIQTVIKGSKVYKTNDTDKSKEHINQIKNNIDILKNIELKTVDSYDDNGIISDLQDKELLLDNIIISKLKNNQKSEILDIIKEFKIELTQKLGKTSSDNNCFDKYDIDYEKETIENLNFVKYGMWDLIFQNCFYKGNEFYFYDQEWLDENVPVEFIIYRAIKYFCEIDKYIPKEELYKINEISKEQIDLFEKLDDILQTKIRDEEVWNIILEKDINRMLAKFNQLEQKNNENEALIIQKSERIKDLEAGMEEATETIKQLEQTIRNITNSASWKMTVPLRKINQILKGDKNIKE